jgi:hypothetical protein
MSAKKPLKNAVSKIPLLGAGEDNQEGWDVKEEKKQITTSCQFT